MPKHIYLALYLGVPMFYLVIFTAGASLLYRLAPAAGLLMMSTASFGFCYLTRAWVQRGSP